MPEWAFCIVGNVIDEHLYGGEKRVLRGSKQFRPDAKLYIVDAFWGTGGDTLIVMGQPRKKGTLIKIAFKRSLIHRFRVKQVYDKRVIRELYLPFGDAELQTTELKSRLEELAEYWNASAEITAKEFREYVRADQESDDSSKPNSTE